jgi:hypothetical protein
VVARAEEAEARRREARRVALQPAVVLLLLELDREQLQALLHEEVQLLLLGAVAVGDRPIPMVPRCIAITK